MAPDDNRPESGTGAAPSDAAATGPTAGYAPGQGLPLGGYATLAAVYAAGVGGFAVLARASGRRLPSALPPGDLLLLATATHKGARLLTKDKITSFVRAPFTRRKEATSASEVMDEPRGHGLRLATGELLACPFCMSAWVGGALFCGYVAAPRATRLVAAALSAVTVADWLQYAWSLTQQQAEG
ncbi:DUF1360 domain-containing protein [Actinacidiphila paucisporea]|uniref:DUF1360 domain-containing protein n=1 Tax=Actinacidiphila paucisporea TaxID=310782 RepID=A0A1M7LP91_9ACTN|nr:DUF1360 domain-containing protein [Actinacidiphila paucisporea]SHM79993.1 Protein of unknown function [Actinacidiphila paucisporea]